MTLVLGLTISIIFVAALIRSAVGFGDALLAMPLLTLVLDLPTATPLVAWMSATIAPMILLNTWRIVDIRAAWRLILASLLGIPIGLLFLREAPAFIVKTILGILLIGYGLYGLVRPTLPVLTSENWSYCFGFLAGMLGGAYNTNGPPIVIYGALRQWPPAHFRATLQCYFLATGFSILVSHGLSGFWTPRVFTLYAYSLPGIVLGIILGGKINQHLPQQFFQKVLYALLIGMGLLLILSS